MKGVGLVSLLAVAVIAVPAPPSDAIVPEYCNTDPASTKPEVHVYSDFNHGDVHEYGWGVPKGFTPDTSETSFKARACTWKDGDTVKDSCGWCDQGAPWIGFEGERPIDFSTRPELSRHRTLTCHLWHKNTPSPPLDQLTPSKNSYDVAAAAIEDPAPAIDVNVAVDFLDASTLEARDVTGDGRTPDNLYRFSVTHSEWCENGALKARGWWHGQELNFYKDVTQKIPINLHPRLDLLFGPYSYDQHAFGIEYDGCAWTSKGGWPCGWCEQKPWTLGALNCQTLQPGYQCTSHRTCYFVDNHMNGKARRGVESPPTSSLPDNTTFSLLTSPVITAPACLVDVNQADTVDSLAPTPTLVDAVASTITFMPQIIHTVLPNTPKGQEGLIVPFHIQVWKYCFSGQRLAAGVWRNGNMAQSLNFTGASDKLNIVQTGARDMFPYYSLDFDFETNRVRFGYPG